MYISMLREHNQDLRRESVTYVLHQPSITEASSKHLSVGHSEPSSFPVLPNDIIQKFHHNNKAGLLTNHEQAMHLTIVLQHDIPLAHLQSIYSPGV